MEIKSGAFKSYRRLDKKSNVDGGVQAGSQIFTFFTCAQKFRSLWRAGQITPVQVSIATELASFYPPELMAFPRCLFSLSASLQMGDNAFHM